MSKPSVLVTVHGYSGDQHQIRELMPVYQHHGYPIVVVGPADSPIEHMDGHICINAGRRAYIGQDSWDRQYLQLKALLKFPQEWFLLNDSDSFVMTPKLPDYLFQDENTVYSNEVTDFRVPGESWQGQPPWPLDYHKGYPLIAMQPPYFLSRKALQKIVDTCEGLQACPTTPFIDWWWVPACFRAHLKHRPFTGGASCETVTPNGLTVMSNCVRDGAIFIHSVKSGAVMQHLRNVHNHAFPAH